MPSLSIGTVLLLLQCCEASFVWFNNMLSRWRASQVKEGATTDTCSVGVRPTRGT